MVTSEPGFRVDSELTAKAKAKDAPDIRLWENDARRMHRHGDDRMVLRQPLRIADGSVWNW